MAFRIRTSTMGPRRKTALKQLALTGQAALMHRHLALWTLHTENLAHTERKQHMSQSRAELPLSHHAAGMAHLETDSVWGVRVEPCSSERQASTFQGHSAEASFPLGTYGNSGINGSRIWRGPGGMENCSDLWPTYGTLRHPRD